MSFRKYFLFTSKKETYKYSWNEEDINETIKEFLWYLPLLITLNLLAFGTRSELMFYYTDTMRRLFLQKPFTTSGDLEITFEDIVTIDDWWHFMENNFLEGVYYDETMIKRTNKSSIDAESYTYDKLVLLTESLFLGPPRIRQLKVGNDSCILHSAFAHYFSNCFAEYSFLNEKRDPNVVDDVGFFIWGELGFYRGGGYTVYLATEKNTSERILKDMKNKQWIERGTRLIVVEFNLYNANADLFSMVKFIAELLPIGGVITSYSIRPFHLLQSRSEHGIFIAVFKIILFIQIVLYTTREVLQIKEKGWKYFKSVWSWISWSLILMVYLLLLFTILRHLWAMEIIEKFNKDPEKYIDMDLITLFQYYMFNLFGLCVFLAWIQMFKFISFNKTMLQLSTTLQRCASDLLGFGVIFTTVFIAFSQLGYLLFGTTNKDFRTMTDSIFTMMRTILGDFDYMKIEQANRILGPIFFLAYIFFVFFVLLNMFLAIINDTYSEVKSEIIYDQFVLWRFMRRTITHFLSWMTCGRLFMRTDESPEDTNNTPRPAEVPQKRPNTRRQMMVRRREMIGTRIFEQVSLAGPGPKPRNEPVLNIDPLQRQLNSIEIRLRNIEMLMDNFVTRVDVLISKLDIVDSHNS